MSTNSNHKAVSPKQGEVASGAGFEDDWVEAEIERLLQSVLIEEESGVGGHNLLQDQYGTDSQEGGLCVSALFSGYLSTLNSQQSDVQALLSDAYTALDSSSDVVERSEIVFRKQPDKEKCMPASPILSFFSEFWHCHSVSTLNECLCDELHGLPVDFCISNKELGTELELTPGQQYGVCAETVVESSSPDVEPVHNLRGASCSNEDSGGQHSLSIEGPGQLSKRTSDTVHCEGREDEDISHESSSTSMSAVVKAVMDRLDSEQKSLEEQLAREQHEREVEITFQIEEAKKIVAEQQKEEINRERILKEMKQEAAIKLQTHWRGYLVQRLYCNKLSELKQLRLQKRFSAAQFIQARWRGYSVRKSYGPVLEAIKEMRKERDREIALLQTQCAVRIQALWRGYSVRSVHGPTLTALRHTRKESLKMKEEAERNRNLMATLLQAVWKGYLVRKKYGPLLITRMEELMKRLSDRREHAATSLQACWRGLCARRRVKQVLQLRNERIALDEQRRRAALVIQAHWRGRASSSGRPKLVSAKEVHQDSSAGVEFSLDKGVDSDSIQSTIHDKLTVTKRLQSALRLKLQEKDTGTRSETVKFDVSCEQTTIIAPELTHSSLGQKEGGAEGEAEVLLEKPCHSSELMSTLTALTPEVWLSVVKERLQQWTASMTPWKEPHAPVVPQSVPISRSRVISTCALNPLSNAKLLAASPKDTPLNQVTQVVVCGCCAVPDVSGLAQCPQLCSLTLTQCGLTSPCSLPSSLSLIELNLQSNFLEQVDLFGVGPGLRFLDLSENRLSSIHGLDKCAQLLHLDLSGNRIARLGGLCGCWHLQKLIIDRNLLVSCADLEHLPFLQTFSCAKNHLHRITTLHNCSLVTVLHLQKNNLQEAPSLPHHLVLRELRLDGNNLTSISPLCQAWLPLLQTLSVAGNCITQLDSLITLVMLQTLDINANSIYDLPLLLQSLHGCMQLQTVILHGNPVSKEPCLQSHLLSVLPSLMIINDQPVPQHQGRQKYELPDIVTSSSVYRLCRRQISEQDDMKGAHIADMELLQNATRDNPNEVKNMLQAKVNHCMQYERLLIRHIREQEKLGRENLPDMTMKESLKQKKSFPVEVQSTTMNNKVVSAAVVLQSVWRGRAVRLSVAVWHSAAVKIQASWRGLMARHAVLLMKQERRRKTWAATIIQAVYRGYWVRHKLSELMQVALHDSDEESDMGDDIDLDIMVEDVLDEDVIPMCPPTPTSPPNLNSSESTKCLHSSQLVRVPTTQLHSYEKKPQPQCHVKVPNFTLPGSVPTEASLQQYKEECSQRQQPASSHVALTHVSKTQNYQATRNSSSSVVSIVDLPETHDKVGPSVAIQEAWTTEEPYNQSPVSCSPPLSRSVLADSNLPPKEATLKEKIVAEWGLKTDAAAQAMIKRAKRQKKFKNMAAQRKKMVDPVERLAAFHKQGQSVAANKQQETPSQLDCYREHSSLKHTKNYKPMYMYQWSHSHAVVHRDRLLSDVFIVRESPRKLLSSRSKKESATHEVVHRSCPTSSSTECSLPQLDQRVLAGHAPTLVGQNTKDSSQSSLKSSSWQDAATDDDSGLKY